MAKIGVNELSRIACEGKRQPSLLRYFLRCMLGFAICFLNLPANADQLSLLINGRSIHMDGGSNKSLNERNWGLGLQYDWDSRESNWVPFATASGLRDSNGNPSYYAGGGVMRRFKVAGANVDLGGLAFVMTRKGYNDDKPFLGALPAMSVGTRNVALNISYVPKVDPKAVPLWFVQLKISLKQFN